MDTQAILERLYGVRPRRARQGWLWRIARFVRRVRIARRELFFRVSQYPAHLAVGAMALAFWIITHIYYYNRLVMLDQGVKVEWAQLEASQQRRNHVQRNLAALLLYYADHETNTMSQLTALRSGRSVTPHSGAHAADSKPAPDLEDIIESQSLEGMLGRLNVVAEQYPTLHLTQTVQHFSENIVRSETDIAARIMTYNSAVNMYRNMTISFPAVLFTKLMGFGEYDFYVPEDPKILKYRELKL